MELSEAITKRRSIRKFDPTKPVSDEAVMEILEAAIMAPSAGNGQSWRFFVIKDATTKHRLATEAGHQRFIDEVPVVIVVCADLAEAEEGYGLRGRDLYSLQETAASIQNMLLTAVSLGLGACWVGAFDEQSASEILGLRDNLRPVAMIPIGVPALSQGKAPPKKDISDVAVFK